jgi:protein required for attachment to host cells
MTRQTNFDPRWARPRTSYVLVADSGRARILKSTGRRLSPRLIEIERLERPTVHRMARELTTDLSGRVYGGGSRVKFGPRVSARSGAQSDYDPRTVEIERFARLLASHLARAQRRERIDELVLIAEPQFLGLLRRTLPEQMRRLISREVPRDLVAAQSAPIIRAAFERLPGRL